MQTREKEEPPKRPRPRSFVGGGNIGFTYDKHHGGIKDFDEPKENGEKKPKRPLSLYEMFSQDMKMERENSSSPSKPDGRKSFARLNCQEKAEEMNQDAHKIKRQVSDKGDEGLGNRKMSDSAKALYVELSSPPTISSPTDEKFNAVSRLRSLFDQGDSAPLLPRTSSASSKERNQPPQSSSHDNKIKVKDEAKNVQVEQPKRQLRSEKIDMERKRKLFGPPAPIKLDDLLKRESPRSPEEVSLPRLRKSFPLSREPYEKRGAKLQAKPKSEELPKRSATVEKDEFEEIHNRRRSLPKKRSSSFEFEGLEDNVQVYGQKSIDINAMLGLDAPKEDPAAEKSESGAEKDEEKEVKEEMGREELKEDVEGDLKELKEDLREIPKEEENKVAEKKDVADEDDSEKPCHVNENITENESPEEDLEEKENVKSDVLLLEPMVTGETEMEDENGLDVEIDVKHPGTTKTIVEEDIVDESRIKDAPLQEQLPMSEDDLIAESHLTIFEEGIPDRKEEKKSVDEELVMPETEEFAEAGIDFNTLDNLEVISKSDDSIIMDYDSFDSFALHVKHDEKEITEEVTEPESSLIDVSVDENRNITATEVELTLKKDSDDKEDGCDVDDSVEKYIATSEDVDEKVEIDKDVPEETIKVSEISNDEICPEEEEEIKENVAENSMENRLEEAGENVDEEVEVVEEAFRVEEDLSCKEAESFEEASVICEEDPVSQLSIIASVAGLDQEDQDQLNGDEETEEGKMHDTVELDDEEYDSDHEVADEDVSGDAPEVDETTSDVEEDTIDDRVEETQEEPYVKPTTSTFEPLNLVLPPSSAQSCLSGRNGEKKKDRKVYFNNDKNDVILTYSPEEYNRSNTEIDALTASAEWELEKRVDEKDMFTVDLDKREGGLGLSIIGLGVGTDSGVEKLGIFVKSLTPNGAAAKDRRIQVHDQILEVNGISLVGVTQDFAANTLRNTSGKVRFMMGRDKDKKYYQAPTSTADPVLQELERKHNLELGEMNARLQKTETRAAIAEHNLDEVREALAEAEERVHVLEEEYENAKNEIEHMKESPFYLHKSLKNEIKKPKHERKSSEKIGSLERSISELTDKLSYSEENLDKIQQERDEKISELQNMLEEAENNLIESKNENNNLVSTLEENSKKLLEAEECLAAANENQENNLKEVQELRMKCNELEMEISDLKEAQLELEQLKLSKEIEKISVEKEQNVMTVNDKEDSNELNKLRTEIQQLSDEIALRNQFADIIVAERDSLKALVSNLEAAQDKQLEAQEKKDIEMAVKMMAYENKVKELETVIRELKGNENSEARKQKKLFPDLEREIRIAQEINYDDEDGTKIEPVKEIEIQSAKTIPFELPPRDYDGRDSPLDVHISHVDTEMDLQEKVKDGDQKSSSSRKSSSSSSSSSDEEKEKGPDNETTGDSQTVEDKNDGIVMEVSILKADVEIQESTPVLKEDEKLEHVTPVLAVTEEANLNKDAISGEIKGDENVDLENVVNPVQKPPRTYSDVSDVRVGRQLRSNSLTERPKVIEEAVEEKAEKEEEKNEFIEVSGSIKVKASNKYQVVVEKGFKREIESKPLDESILKDLPESSVDSDSEIIENKEMKPDEGQKEIELDAHVNAIENKIVESTPVEVDSVRGDSTNIESTTVVVVEGTKLKSSNEHNESTAQGVTENNSPKQISPHSPKTDEGSATEKDRSSFIESFSKDPSFGSWFSGEVTILENDNDDEHADEIASKVVEGKERALSSTSSCSNDSRVKEELNTSIKLDESYLQKSQLQEGLDAVDSPLNRMESLAVDSPLSEQSKIDDIELINESERPLSTNFDDLPTTEVLPNTAQHDKRKLASAIPRKSPKPVTKKPMLTESEEEPRKPPASPQEARKAESIENIRGASASTENLAVSIDYTKKDPDKEKRKSFFGFLTKLGGKKKHKKSMENLLVVDEANEGPSKENRDAAGKENVDDEDGGVVPLEMQRDVEVRISSDSGVETQQSVNGVSSEASDSVPSSSVSSPTPSNGIEEVSSPPPPRSQDELSWIQRPVIEWDVRQVGLWLIRLDLGQYSQTFQGRNIDGNELLNLNGARLKDLGVVDNDHRALIKKNIKEFKAKSENRRDPKKDGKTKDKLSKKVFWKGKYTINE